MSRKAPAPEGPITRADLEHQFASFQGRLRGKIEARKNTLVSVAGVGAMVVILVVFLLGKRSARRKTTLVEIRRV